MGEPDLADTPAHPVTLSPFYIDTAPVTQAAYQSLMGVNPSQFAGAPQNPVEQVTWNQAVEYCRRLTEAQRSAGCLPNGRVYRLPTEAEWEYACRAGTTNAFGLGPALRSGMANFDGNFALVGSWVVADRAAGIGMREDDSLVTRDSSRFVPHMIQE